MDELYIGDIPITYKYAQFSNDYVTLYNKATFVNETTTYYRIYFNAPGFFYSTGTQSFGYTSSTFQEIPVTNNFLHRSDISQIFVVSFIIIFALVVLINMVTSVFKKGGVLGGLL